MPIIPVIHGLFYRNIFFTDRTFRFSNGNDFVESFRMPSTSMIWKMTVVNGLRLLSTLSFQNCKEVHVFLLTIKSIIVIPIVPIQCILYF